jgi:hypothetical protein
MAKNVIMRPVYNRPEMLKLSIEYEIKAREYHTITDNLLTLFIIEHGATPEVLELVESYPYNSTFLKRDKKYGLTPNILEGMKTAFDLSDFYLIYIEDDILLHETYFQYIDTVLNHPNRGKFSIISPFNFDDNGDVNDVRKGHHYAALAPVINKEFYIRFIAPCSNVNYYNNRSKFVIDLNEHYKDHWESKDYKYKDATHNEQAGLINRLVDAAMIDMGMHVYMPSVNRQQHIGYFGKNRPGGIIPGDTYDARVSNLREIITSAEKMYDYSATKQYNDYKTFSPKLNKWEGSINIK